MSVTVGMKTVVAAGFASVVITLIGCTYFLDKSIRRNSAAGDSDYVVRAIEDEGKAMRKYLEEVRRDRPKPAAPVEEYDLPWIVK